MSRPEIVLQSVQTEPLEITTLEKKVLPQIESAARVIGRWAYEHELITSTKLFNQASGYPSGVVLYASESHSPVMEFRRQNQHYITVEFKDHAPDELHAKFMATAFGLKRNQKFQTALTMESALDKTLDFEKTRGEISFSDSEVPFELIYRYDIKTQSGKLAIGELKSDVDEKTLLGDVEAGQMTLRSPWPGHLPEYLQTVLPRYTKETFQQLLYSMIYSVDLTPDWKLTPIVFTRNAFALIHTAGKHG